MKIAKLLGVLAASVLWLTAVAPAAYAGPIVLGSAGQCSATNATHGITTGDVTGNLGGSTDCWGAFNGSDPGPGGSFEIGGAIFDFVAKQQLEPVEFDGFDIGLDVIPDSAPSDTFGTWEYDPGLFSADAFLIVLKTGNKPGYGVWLFDGSAANSYSGDWSVAWDKDLSHLAIYANGATTVAEPTSLALLGLGLLGLGFARRKRTE